MQRTLRPPTAFGQNGTSSVTSRLPRAFCGHGHNSLIAVTHLAPPPSFESKLWTSGRRTSRRKCHARPSGASLKALTYTARKLEDVNSVLWCLLCKCLEQACLIFPSFGVTSWKMMSRPEQFGTCRDDRAVLLGLCRS